MILHFISRLLSLVDMPNALQLSLKGLLFSFLICSPLHGAAFWPFPKKRFTGTRLVDAGTLGLTGDRRIVAFGDFSGDQL